MLRHVRYGALALAIACGGAQSKPEPSVALPAQAGGSSSGTDPVALVQPTAKDERDAAVPIGADDPAWGSRTALVTIVEIADLQCPYCARAADTVAQLEKAYGDRTLRVVFKHQPLPFHSEAKPAAEAAETVRALAGNTAFWSFYDLAFHNQAQLGPAQYEVWARQCGVPLQAFRDAVASHRFESKVDADMALAKKLGATGTPTFFINGVRLVGAQPSDKFREIIDAQVTASKERLAKGVAAEDLYTAAAKENYAPPPASDPDTYVGDAKTVWKVPLGTSPQLGSKTALVTIVQWADFQCPFCKREEPVMQQIRSTYGNDVRVVFKHMPLPMHPRAQPAAELALEARAEKGDAGFWRAHDALFDSQPNLEDADLEKVATDLHLDVAKVKAAIASSKYAAQITHDSDEGDDFDVNGIPQMFINGRRISGAQPFDKVKPIIDEEIVKARALVAAGTAPDKVYDELLKNGRSVPEQKTVTFTGTAPVKGPASAAVTIVELADFQCPFCKRVDDTLNELLKAYPTRVKLVWRQMPLHMHPQAELAAEASAEAFKQKGNDGFWKMHDALFAHQQDPDGLERNQIDGYARTIGLDMTRFAAALDTGQNAGTVDVDAKAATAAGVSGTPAFFIGRGNATGSWSAYYVSGAQPLAKLKRVVDIALGAHP